MITYRSSGRMCNNLLTVNTLANCIKRVLTSKKALLFTLCPSVFYYIHVLPLQLSFKSLYKRKDNLTKYSGSPVIQVLQIKTLLS